jgi:prepilin-type N-terminal cleavage/methylation domain-containing protein
MKRIAKRKGQLLSIHGDSRKGFTLIELFIAIAIIALVSTVFLYRSKPMLDHYRFSQGVEKLKREIAFSKRIAQTASTYIEFSIEQQGNQCVCIRKTDEPLKLKGALNTPILIPSVSLEGGQKQIILITSSGWIEKNNEIKIFWGSEKKTIDARNNSD